MKVMQHSLLQRRLGSIWISDVSVQILDHARAHGRVTVREMVAITGASRNTLKEYFKSLLENGHLELHGKGRGAWYRMRCTSITVI